MLFRSFTGTRIAFTSKRGDDENAALYVMRLDGGEPERLVELPFAVSAPKWMPDGRGIVFATRVIPELAGKLAAADLAAMREPPLPHVCRLCASGLPADLAVGAGRSVQSHRL